METLTICYMKNLWDNLNLFKLYVWRNIFIFEYYDWIICCEHLEFVLNPMASRDCKLSVIFSP